MGARNLMLCPPRITSSGSLARANGRLHGRRRVDGRPKLLRCNDDTVRGAGGRVLGLRWSLPHRYGDVVCCACAVPVLCMCCARAVPVRCPGCVRAVSGRCRRATLCLTMGTPTIAGGPVGSAVGLTDGNAVGLAVGFAVGLAVELTVRSPVSNVVVPGILPLDSKRVPPAEGGGRKSEKEAFVEVVFDAVLPPPPPKRSATPLWERERERCGGWGRGGRCRKRVRACIPMRLSSSDVEVRR